VRRGKSRWKTMRGMAAWGRVATLALVSGAVSCWTLALAKPAAADPPALRPHEQATPKAEPSGETQAPQAPENTEPAARGNAPSSGSATVLAPTQAEATVVIASATIVRIDKSARKLTLLGPDGQAFDVKAGPNVDLDSLRVGDRANATYYEEVAVAINRHPRGGPHVAARTVQRGGVTAKQATVTARILGVDVADDTVLVRMPDGRLHTVKVADPALQAELPKIRAGEDVDLTYTQAVATDIEPVTEQPFQPDQPLPPAQPAPSGPGVQPAR
jgi:hypothetical protein